MSKIEQLPTQVKGTKDKRVKWQLEGKFYSTRFYSINLAELPGARLIKSSQEMSQARLWGSALCASALILKKQSLQLFDVGGRSPHTPWFCKQNNTRFHSFLATWSFSEECLNLSTFSLCHLVLLINTTPRMPLRAWDLKRHFSIRGQPTYVGFQLNRHLLNDSPYLFFFKRIMSKAKLWV